MIKRLDRQAGRYALVDGIPFQLPVYSRESPALMAVFPINPKRAQALLPGNELHLFRLWNKGLLVITVINYRKTSIGQYIEYSIGIACTHGPCPAPPLLPGFLAKLFGTGQFVYDLPVSTEISVKGGKGIWGMPKHQAPLNFIVGETTVSSQYDLDNQLAMKIEIARPQKAWLPISMGGVNYCAFRGMLMKSYVHFQGKVGFSLFQKGSAKITIGNHPRLAPLKDLEIGDPIFTAFFPETRGLLDDHFESWFLSEASPPEKMCGEGMESVVGLGQGQEWPPPPNATV